MSGFGLRLVTAGILAPLLLTGVLYLPTHWLALILAVFVLLAAWEWSALMGWQHLVARAAYTLAVAGALASLYLNNTIALSLCMLALGWWLLAFRWLIRQQLAAPDVAPPLLLPLPLAGLLILVPAWGGLVHLHGLGEGGRLYIVLLLLLIWSADSGAYFAGRTWGRRRLASRISPGKTWAGVGGAMVATAALASVAALYLEMGLHAALLLLSLCLLTTVVSIIGDLAESLFKRRAGLKDSGSLLPGHGGILDRIDSLTAAAPFFILGLYLIGILRKL